jgi:hypothetical protein
MTQELNQKDLRKIDFERVKIETITVLIATDTHLTSCSGIDQVVNAITLHTDGIELLDYSNPTEYQLVEKKAVV